MRKPTIIIADDHPITAKGMETVLLKMGFNIVGMHQNGVHALNQIIIEEPDFVLLDVQMIGLSGIDIAEQIKSKNLKSKIIIYTMYTDISLFERAKSINVHGYLLKEFALEDLNKCITAIKKGKQWFHPELEEKLKKDIVSFSPELYAKLSIREKQILTRISENASTKEIANEMFITEKTVESHRTSIIKKLDLPRKKNALLVWAIKNNGFFSLMD